jgi:predicted membrane protein
MAMLSRFHHRHKHNQVSRIVLGLLIILLGSVLLADNMDILPHDVKDMILTWQMLLIAIGLINMANREFFSGFVLVFIGSFFLASQRIHWGFDFASLFWPVLLIAFGLMILIKLGFNRPRCEKTQECSGVSSHDDILEDSAIFGGVKKNITSQQFKGGHILAIFGGFELDFTQSQLAPGKNVLEMIFVFGGCTLVFPPDWKIQNEVTTVLGGVEDKRRFILNNIQTGEESVLILKGVAVLGGCEIKSFPRTENT